MNALTVTLSALFMLTVIDVAQASHPQRETLGARNEPLGGTPRYWRPPLAERRQVSPQMRQERRRQRDTDRRLLELERRQRQLMYEPYETRGKGSDGPDLGGTAPILEY